MIVLERHRLPGLNLKISCLMHPHWDLCLGHENVQFLSGNFYARIFSWQEFKSHQELTIKILLPGSTAVFSWATWRRFFLSEGSRRVQTDFSAGFLLRYMTGIFPSKRSHPLGTTGQLGRRSILTGSQRVLGILVVSWWDPGTCITLARCIDITIVCHAGQQETSQTPQSKPNTTN